MPESLLNLLKLCLLALLYLFFFRVLRAVWVEVRGPRLVNPDKRRGSGGGGGRRGGGGGGGGGGKASGGARLAVVDPEEQRGVAYELADELTVGRAAGCQVTLDDTFVSQLHARVFRRDDQLFVEDLGSTNGTYVNRKRVTGPVPVRRGDLVQVGRTVLEVE